MSALTTLTLVWLGANHPGERSRPALDAWARQHDSTFEAPVSEGPDPRQSASDALAAAVDRALDQARDQLHEGEESAAASTLDGVDSTLRAHPEILQASWLMAERSRLQARLLQSTSPSQASQWEARADRLEGSRAPSFGDSQAVAAPSASTIEASIAVHGARTYAVYWDGAPASSRWQTLPGEHHLLVFRGARVAWAGWVSVLATGKIDVWVPEATPCSIEDLDGVAIDNDSHVRVPPGVRCPEWSVAYARRDETSIAITRCEGDRCRAFETSSAGSPNPGPQGEPTASKSFLPGWVAWTLTGAGVAAATSIVLWQTGVFSKSSEGRLVYDGSHL